MEEDISLHMPSGKVTINEDVFALIRVKIWGGCLEPQVPTAILFLSQSGRERLSPEAYVTPSS